MLSTRQLALAGSLLRASLLIQRGWMDSAIFERLSSVYPGGTREQYLQIIALAHKGVDFADRVDWHDPTYVIDLSKAPQLPQG